MIRALHFYIVTILIIRVLCITHIIDLHPKKKKMNNNKLTAAGNKNRDKTKNIRIETTPTTLENRKINDSRETLDASVPYNT